ICYRLGRNVTSMVQYDSIFKSMWGECSKYWRTSSHRATGNVSLVARTIVHTSGFSQQQIGSVGKRNMALGQKIKCNPSVLMFVLTMGTSGILKRRWPCILQPHHCTVQMWSHIDAGAIKRFPL